MINRAVVIVQCLEPALEWIKSVDPDPAFKNQITLAEINEDTSAFLISERSVETPQAFERWVKANYKPLFEDFLESWYTKEEMWPKKRTYALFKQWFRLKYHSIVEDTLDEPIVDED